MSTPIQLYKMFPHDTMDLVIDKALKVFSHTKGTKYDIHDSLKIGVQDDYELARLMIEKYSGYNDVDKALFIECIEAAIVNAQKCYTSEMSGFLLAINAAKQLMTVLKPDWKDTNPMPAFVPRKSTEKKYNVLNETPVKLTDPLSDCRPYNMDWHNEYISIRKNIKNMSTDQIETQSAQTDLEIVMTQTGVDEQKAKSALEKNKGDIVNSIMELTV